MLDRGDHVVVRVAHYGYPVAAHAIHILLAFVVPDQGSLAPDHRYGELLVCVGAMRVLGRDDVNLLLSRQDRPLSLRHDRASLVREGVGERLRTESRGDYRLADACLQCLHARQYLLLHPESRLREQPTRLLGGQLLDQFAVHQEAFHVGQEDHRVGADAHRDESRRPVRVHVQGLSFLTHCYWRDDRDDSFLQKGFDDRTPGRLHLPRIAAFYRDLPPSLVNDYQPLLPSGAEDPTVEPRERNGRQARAFQDLHELFRDEPAHHHREDLDRRPVGVPALHPVRGDDEALLLSQLRRDLGDAVPASVDEYHLVRLEQLLQVCHEIWRHLPFDDVTAELHHGSHLSLHRMEGSGRDPLLLVEPEHEVHHLHGVARRPLEQVVDRTHRDYPVAPLVNLEADVAEVRPDDYLGVGQPERPLLVLDHPDEGLAVVERAIHLPHVGVPAVAFVEDVA